MSDEFPDGDIRVDLIRTDPEGGQKVGTGRFLIQVTHLPTGMAVTASDARGQHRGRYAAITLLRMLVDELG